MQTFFHYYQKEITPQIEAIDIFLKTEAQPYNLKEVAGLLRLSEAELQKIRKDEGISTINTNQFFEMMRKGSSRFCRMLCRELLCGGDRYTPKDIAYIYDLSIQDVEEAAKGQTVFLAKDLPKLYKNIKFDDKRCLF